MQQNILAQYPQGHVRVYAVWFNMLWSDSRDGWDSTVLPDARVTHLWDGQKLVGRWFAAHDGDPQGTYWDAYWLYGPDARWGPASTAAPGPLIGSGGPVIQVGEQLQSQLGSLLTGPGSGVPPWPGRVWAPLANRGARGEGRPRRAPDGGAGSLARALTGAFQHPR